jgi:hypothetical protein
MVWDVAPAIAHLAMRSPDEVQRVRALAAEGHPQAQIALITGIPRTTVRGWLAGRVPRHALKRALLQLHPHEFLEGKEADYVYLLGLYLGDGHISQMSRTFRFRLILDRRYSGIARSAVVALRAILPENKPSSRDWPRLGTIVVTSYFCWWPRLIPQHGPGRKHERKIVLTGWQLALTSRHPRELVRGLIHSDGCRFVARQPGRQCTYSYPRYGFRNESEDILQIFCHHLAILGVDCTRPTPTMIQVARREAVARLDKFVGPKS